VECFTDDQCPAPKTCQLGHCMTSPLKVDTKDLPDGQIEAAYAAGLAASGGQPPYTWSVTDGTLPAGVTLNAAVGELSGTPTAAGTSQFKVTVKDDLGATAQAALSIVIHGKGLTIVSKSPLPDGEDGTPYSFVFKALGGTPPYGWMVTAGKIPGGLTLGSDGTLAGTPADHGPFEFTVRVVDVGDPLQQASAAFRMNVKIAPLVIFGDQEINLFLTKAIVLPLITVVQGIPIPYSAQLQAKGGLKPYTWSEVEMPGFVKTFIPQAGIPKGLTLGTDGKLSGSVTDTAQAFELKVPFVNFTLTGFFFMAKVEDVQAPPASDQAIFLIPTIPVNLGGGGGLP